MGWKLSSNTKTQPNESKKIKKETILIIILCVLLIVALLLPSKDILSGLFNVETNIQTGDFAYNTEINLQNLLKNVNGVGNVDVMVTLSTSEKEILAKNIEVYEEAGVKKSVETIIMVNGKPYVTGIKMIISDIISSALNVPFENIKIYKRK